MEEPHEENCDRDEPPATGGGWLGLGSRWRRRKWRQQRLRWLVVLVTAGSHWPSPATGQRIPRRKEPEQSDRAGQQGRRGARQEDQEHLPRLLTSQRSIEREAAR